MDTFSSLNIHGKYILSNGYIMIYPNIIYQDEWGGPYSKLCEADFLNRILSEVKAIMKEEFDRFDFYIYSCNGNDNPPKPIILTNNNPRIIIYISDEHSTVPTYLSEYFVAVFKAYLPRNFEKHKLYSFPLGYHQDVPLLPILSINERENNVFFSGNLNFNRIFLYKELSFFFSMVPNYIYKRIIFRIKNSVPMDLSRAFKSSYIQFTGGFKRGISGKEYAYKLHNSKIAICPPGFHSTETFRHFEAMRAGCIIVSKEMPDTFFYKNSPFIILKNWNELRPTINKLLNDPDRMKDIHLKTLAWWREICSEKAVASYMVNKIKNSAGY